MGNERDKLAQEMARFIIEFEADDFYYYCEDPSPEHIYYKAVLFLHGEAEAIKELDYARPSETEW